MIGKILPAIRQFANVPAVTTGLKALNTGYKCYIQGGVMATSGFTPRDSELIYGSMKYANEEFGKIVSRVLTPIFKRNKKTPLTKFKPLSSASISAETLKSLKLAANKHKSINTTV